MVMLEAFNCIEEYTEGLLQLQYAIMYDKMLKCSITSCVQAPTWGRVRATSLARLSSTIPKRTGTDDAQTSGTQVSGACIL